MKVSEKEDGVVLELGDVEAGAVIGVFKFHQDYRGEPSTDNQEVAWGIGDQICEKLEEATGCDKE